jgi:hypothetical protein
MGISIGQRFSHEYGEGKSELALNSFARSW